MNKAAVFLDRDGTLVEHHDYLTDPALLKLLPGVADGLNRLKKMGYLLVVVTNQSAVARGMLTETDLGQIHDRLTRLLNRQGVFLDGLYYCPYHPEAVVRQYRCKSELRKPAPGMLLLAAERLGIELGRSWMIGDDDRDIEAGRAAGCRTILLEQRCGPLVQRGASTPDLAVSSFLEAVAFIEAQSGAEILSNHP